MKWLLLVMLAVASWQARAAATIDRISLFNAQNPGVIWMTAPPTTQWILGVSDDARGPLLNQADSSITGIAQGQYWLFADPAELGRLPVLTLHLSDGTQLSALFRVSGSNGTAQSWARIGGSAALSLGWAEGVADLVGKTNGVRPNGIDDLVMVATLGRDDAPRAAVPEPASLALWLVGLGALAGLRRQATPCQPPRRSRCARRPAARNAHAG